MLVLMVCKVCGNTEKSHNFRHAFDGKIKVKCTKKHKFTIDCNQYEETKEIICGVPQCTLPENYHEKRDAQHKFLSTEKVYREIKFSPPLDTPCKVCKLPLETHEENLCKTHFFTMEITLKNAQKTDIIKVCHPFDDEIKITLLE